MNENAPKKNRQSSPRFPFINLAKALDRAEQLRKAGGGGPVLVSAARQTWGYGPKSSGGHQTIAALKAYGLIEEVGSGDQRQLKLTEKGGLYFRDERPEERAKLIKEFVLAPKAMLQAWNDWQGLPPEDHVARSHLKIVRDFADNAAEEFLGIYRENISFAELTLPDKVTNESGVDGEDDGAEEIAVGDLIQAEVDGQLAFPKPVRVIAMREERGRHWLFVEGHKAGVLMEQAELVEKAIDRIPAGSAMTPPIYDLGEDDLRQGWHEERLLDDGGGEIFIRYEGEPSPGRYEFIRDYLDFKLRRLEKQKNKEESGE